MANISVLNMEGKEVGTLELNDAIFAVEVKEHLMHRAVVLQLANNRQGTQSAKTRAAGTQSAKTRAAVRGGGRKPWRQKGTGHARQGSIRSPQWKGGGVVFAPQPRDYSFKMNRKEKQAAICSALTTKLNENKLIVLDEFKLGEIKTKAAKKVLEDIKANKALIILGEKEENVILSARNLESVATTLTNSISVYDILNHDSLVITKDAVSKIEEVYA